MVCVTHSGIRSFVPAQSTASSRRMNSLGSCCRLFRQTLLATNSHCAGLQAQSRRAYALPRAALSRSRQAKQEAATSDNVAENKVRRACNCKLCFDGAVAWLYSVKQIFRSLTISGVVQAKALEQVMKDLNARFGRGTIMQLGQAEPQKL